MALRDLAHYRPVVRGGQSDVRCFTDSSGGRNDDAGTGESLHPRADRRAGTPACAFRNGDSAENRSVAAKVDPWELKDQSGGAPRVGGPPSPKKGCESG